MRALTQRLPLARAPALLRFASIQRQLPFHHPSSPSSVAPQLDSYDTIQMPPSVARIDPSTLEQHGLRWKYAQLAAADAAHWLAPPSTTEYDDRGEMSDEPDLGPELDEVDGDREAVDVMYMWRGPHHGEVKGNPTESEADVWAERTDEDPLPPEMQHTIEMPAGEAAAKPTASEERVKADRMQEDPLKSGGYC